MIALILELIVIILLILVLIKVSRKKENYCVDISGGFEPPCGCQGDCVIDGSI